MATRDTGGQQKATRSREETDEVEASVDTDVAERQKELTEDVDSILDEIDEVLEANAEEFVRRTYKREASDHYLCSHIWRWSQEVPCLREVQAAPPSSAGTGRWVMDSPSIAWSAIAQEQRPVPQTSAAAGGGPGPFVDP